MSLEENLDKSFELKHNHNHNYITLCMCYRVSILGIKPSFFLLFDPETLECGCKMVFGYR